MEIEEDGTLPDFSSSDSSGEKPTVLCGKYADQVSWTIQYIKKYIDLNNESVAFLHVKGGRWFSFLESALIENKMIYATITQKSEWPQGNENIALSTFHSSKGLEFDYVFIWGLAQELTPHGKDPDDDQLERLRRLVSMGIGRARKGVILGYEKGTASTLVNYLKKSTYNKVNV